MSNIELLHGDCLELMKNIPDESIDLILCDLPYGTTASNWDKAIPMSALWEQYNRVLTKTGTVVLFSNGTFTPRVMCSNLESYKYRWVWVKNNSTNFVHAKNRPLVKSEDILVFSKGSMGHLSQLGAKRMTYNPQGIVEINIERKASKNQFGTIAGVRPSHKPTHIQEFTNYPCDVLKDFKEDATTKRCHPNQKPISLLEYLIRTYTNDGNIVLDNCMGGGSTGVACVNTERDFIGIELDDKYFSIAEKRISEAKEDYERRLFNC